MRQHLPGLAAWRAQRLGAQRRLRLCRVGGLAHMARCRLRVAVLLPLRAHRTAAPTIATVATVATSATALAPRAAVSAARAALSAQSTGAAVPLPARLSAVQRRRNAWADMHQHPRGLPHAVLSIRALPPHARRLLPFRARVVRNGVRGVGLMLRRCRRVATRATFVLRDHSRGREPHPLRKALRDALQRLATLHRHC